MRRYEFVCRKRLGVEKMPKKFVNVLTNKKTLVLDNSAGVNTTINNTVLHGDVSEHSAVTPSHSTTTDSSADYVSSLTEIPILPCGTDESMESNENSPLPQLPPPPRNTIDVSTQCTSIQSTVDDRSLMMEIDNIRKERNTALAEVNELTSKLMRYSNLKHKKSKRFKYYTGITCETFDNVFKYLATSLPKVCHSKISFEDQFLMTLIYC